MSDVSPAPPPPFPPPGPGAQPMPVYPAAAPYVLASKGKRFGAFLLEGVLAIVTLFIGWLIWSIIIWSKGQTPAKSILKMRVVKLDTGRAATTGDMALRELVAKWLLGSITSGIYTIVSAIFVIADPQSQGLWDKICGTVVIDDPDDRYAPAA